MKERRREVGRLVKLCTSGSHRPPRLRPFPDADASISRSGNAARRITGKLQDTIHLCISDIA